MKPLTPNLYGKPRKRKESLFEREARALKTAAVAFCAQNGLAQHTYVQTSLHFPVFTRSEPVVWMVKTVLQNAPEICGMGLTPDEALSDFIENAQQTTL